MTFYDQIRGKTNLINRSVAVPYGPLALINNGSTKRTQCQKSELRVTVAQQKKKSEINEQEFVHPMSDWNFSQKV